MSFSQFSVSLILHVEVKTFLWHISAAIETRYDEGMRHYLYIAAASMLLLTHQYAGAQEIIRGTLLVATADLAESTFSETVLLVLHHDQDGSIAIMINRPTNLAPMDAFPELTSIENYSGNLYLGGPVSPSRAFVLVRQNDIVNEGSVRIVDDVFLSGDFSLLSSLDASSLTDTYARVFAGHAQWGAGQLPAEVAAGAWRLANGNATDVFSQAPLSLWEQALSTHDEQIAATSR